MKGSSYNTLDIQQELGNILKNAGASADWTPFLSMVIMLVLLGGASYLLFLITRQIIIRVFHSFFRRTTAKWDDAFVERKVFLSMAHLAPLILIRIFLPVIFAHYPSVLPFLAKLTDVYLVLVVVKILVSFLRAVEFSLAGSAIFKDKPIASYFQLSRIVVYIGTGILVLSILMSKSPVYFLSAFGAMTAILLLIFKDTILGLVASVQIAANDMVRVGDWIEMPKYNADGDVTAINLNTVKVSNWDKTITTVPTYYFITESFKNWRGMQESGGRRIKRSLYINLRTIKFVDAELRERFKKFQLVSHYVSKRQLEIENYNVLHTIDTSELINGRRMTNIGVFRNYAETYLRNHKGINQKMTLMVRQLAPEDKGLPVEIYCFTNTVKWLEYEPIQADIFDHLLAAAQHFDLEVFQSPAGSDIILAGERVSVQMK